MSLTQFLTGCRFEGVLSTKASNGTSGSLVAKTELFEIQGKNSNHFCLVLLILLHIMYFTVLGVNDWKIYFSQEDGIGGIWMCAKSLQSCLTLCDTMGGSLPGSSAHGILQARILDWVAIPFSRGSAWPRDWTHVCWVSCIGRQVLYHRHHLESPRWHLVCRKSLPHTLSFLICESE